MIDEVKGTEPDSATAKEMLDLFARNQQLLTA